MNDAVVFIFGNFWPFIGFCVVLGIIGEITVNVIRAIRGSNMSEKE